MRSKLLAILIVALILNTFSVLQVSASTSVSKLKSKYTSTTLATAKDTVESSPGVSYKRHVKIKYYFWYKRYSTDPPKQEEGTYRSASSKFKIVVVGESKARVEVSPDYLNKKWYKSKSGYAYLKDVGGKVVKGYGDVWANEYHYSPYPGEGIRTYKTAQSYGPYEDYGTASAWIDRWSPGDWCTAELSGVEVTATQTKTVYIDTFLYEADCGYDPVGSAIYGGWAGLKDAYIKVLDYTNTIEVKCLDQLGQTVLAKFILYNAVDTNADGKADSNGGVLGAGYVYYVWRGVYDYGFDTSIYSSDYWTKWSYEELELSGDLTLTNGKLDVEGDGTVTIKYTRYYKVVVNHTDGGTTNPEGIFWKVHGDSLTATATPNFGFVFSHWIVKYKSGGTWKSYNSTSNPITVTINKPHILTAVFVTEPSGKSSLTVVARMHCGFIMYGINVSYRVNGGKWKNGKTSFTIGDLRKGDVVELKLAESFPFEWSAIEYTKDDWLGWSWSSKGFSGNKTEPFKITVNWDGNKKVYAVFKQKSRGKLKLTVYVKDYETDKPIQGAKVVLSSPAMDSNPDTVDPDPFTEYTNSQGKVVFRVGKVPITVEASKSGYESTGDKSKPSKWSGTIYKDTTITLYLKKSPETKLVVYVKYLNNDGEVVDIVQGKKVRIDGRDYYTDNEGKVELKVSPGLHVVYIPEESQDWDKYYFAKWSDGNKDNPRYITVAKGSTKTLTAYVWRECKVVIKSDSSLTTNPSDENWYKYGKTISITASPSNKFDHWDIAKQPSGSKRTSTDNPLSLTVDSGYEVYARARAEVELVITVKYLDYRGRVVSVVQGKRVKVDGTTYTTDSSGRISISVSVGRHTIYIPEEYRVKENGAYWQKYYFAKWSDGSKNNPRSFNINDDTELIVYVWRKCRVVIGGASELTVSPSGTKWYKYKYSLSIKASPNDKFAFWSITEHPGTSRTSTQNPLSLTITRGYEVYAHAKQQPPPPGDGGDTTYKLRVYCYYLDYRGKVISTIWGKTVKIDSKTYATNRYGYVEVRVSKGYHTVEVPKQTHWRGYQKYSFARWSDGSTSNPRRVYVNKDTTLKAYCWRYCKVVITAEPPLKTSPSDTHWYKWNYPLSIKVSPSDKFERWVVTPEVGNAFTSTRNPLWLRVKKGYNVKADAKDEVELVVTVKYLDYRGKVVSTVWGMPIKVDGKVYRTGRDGRVSISVTEGYHTIEILDYNHWRGYQRFYFAKWWDNNEENPRKFYIDRDTEVIAYVWRECKVVITADSGLTTDPSDTKWYKYRYPLSIKATPENKFDHWAIKDEYGNKQTSSSNPLSLTINRGYDVHAVAKQVVYYKLTVYVKWVDYKGDVKGSVANKVVKVDGTEYKTDRDGKLELTLKEGSHTVEITAETRSKGWEKYELYKWSDDNRQNPRAVNLDSDLTLTAYVWRKWKVVITSDSDLTTKPSGTKWYGHDYRLSISASPTSKFDYWSVKEEPEGNSFTSTDNPIKLTIDIGYQVHAKAKTKVGLIVTVKYLDYQEKVIGVVQGKKVLIDGVEYKTDSSGRVSITVTVGTHTIEIPEEYRVWEDGEYWQKYTFAKWHDGDKSNPRTFSINEDTTITAYLWREFKVSISSDEELNTNPSGTHWYRYKYTLTVSVSPAEKFKEWSIEEKPTGNSWTSKDNPLSLVIDRGYQVHARAKASYTLTVYVRDYSTNKAIQGATVTINGTDYLTNAQGKVQASVIEGYYIISASKEGYEQTNDPDKPSNWKGGITSDTTITLYLKRQEYTLTVHVLNAKTNTPVEKALVTVNGVSRYTNSEGTAVFTLNKGTYTVTATHELFQSASKTVNLDRDREVTLRLNPREVATGQVKAYLTRADTLEIVDPWTPNVLHPTEFFTIEVTTSIDVEAPYNLTIELDLPEHFKHYSWDHGHAHETGKRHFKHEKHNCHKKSHIIRMPSTGVFKVSNLTEQLLSGGDKWVAIPITVSVTVSKGRASVTETLSGTIIISLSKPELHYEGYGVSKGTIKVYLRWLYNDAYVTGNRMYIKFKLLDLSISEFNITEDGKCYAYTEIETSNLIQPEPVTELTLTTSKPFMLPITVTYREIACEVLHRDENELVLKVFKWPSGGMHAFIKLEVWEIDPETYEEKRLITTIVRETDLDGVVTFSDWSQILNSIPVNYWRIYVEVWPVELVNEVPGIRYSRFLLLQNPPF